MHLDTYFMILGRDTCLVEGTRFRDLPYREVPPNSRLKPFARDRRPRVDIYTRNADEYVLQETDVRFPEFLYDYLGIQSVITVFLEDQYAYGCNLLCLRDLVVSGSVSKYQNTIQLESYRRQLRHYGVDYRAIDFTNIRSGYGANHCMTQVLVRA
jgi:arginine deiminase